MPKHHYKESKEILQSIKSAKKILINCHLRPDPDSVSSALALSLYLESLGIESTIISPDPISKNLQFLKGANSILNINYDDINFPDYDLFIVLDSGNENMIGDSNFKAKIETIKIDHHTLSDDLGNINLVDTTASSTCEMLYYLLKSWEANVSKEIAKCLLTGIIADTGVFQFHGASDQTFLVAAELVKLGADKSEIILNIYRSDELSLLKFWGEVLVNMKLEKNFAWSAVKRDVYEKCGKPIEGKSSAASMFSRVIKDTDFGIIIVEEEEGKVTVSIRSRVDDFDVSKIANDLDGGGHASAAAATIKELKFDDAVDKVLQAARKFAK